MTDQEAHDALAKLARDYDAQSATNDQAIDAAHLPAAPERTMQMPEMDLRPEAQAGTRPGSIPAQVGKMATAAAPAAAPARPAVDLSKPLGYSPPQDTELRGLQADAKRRRGEAALGQSVADFTERPTNALDAAMRLGGGGVSAPPAKTQMWKEHAAEGEQAIGDLKERRQSEAGMAKSDPNSPTAQMYRSIITRMHPGMSEQLAGATEAQLVTAYPWIEKFSHDNAELLKAKTAADAAAEAKAKPGPLEQEKLNETIRHNKADEKRPRGAVVLPSPSVVAGKFDSIPDHAERETVRAIVEGRAPAPAPGSKFGQHIMGLVAQVDPTFDSTKYGSYQHARTEQSTNASITAAKAVTHHMELLRHAVDALPEGMIDTPGANRLAQGVAGITGSDKYTAMKTEAAIVAAELAQALGEKDVEGRAMVQHLVDPTQTKAQWAKSLPALEMLRDEKLGIYKETLQNLGPTKSGAGGASTSGQVEIVDKKGQKYSVPAAESEALKAELRGEGLL